MKKKKTRNWVFKLCPSKLGICRGVLGAAGGDKAGDNHTQIGSLELPNGTSDSGQLVEQEATETGV